MNKVCLRSSTSSLCGPSQPADDLMYYAMNAIQLYMTESRAFHELPKILHIWLNSKYGQLPLPFSATVSLTLCDHWSCIFWHSFSSAVFPSLSTLLKRSQSGSLLVPPRLRRSETRIFCRLRRHLLSVVN